MRRTGILHFLLIALLLAGCDEDSSTDPARATPDEIVAAQVLLVQEAARAFAADNQGEYPADVATDETAAGLTLVDYLPDGQMLVNPFTGQPTEPRNGRASTAGEIGYLVHAATGVNYGYTITARGESENLEPLDNIRELELAVIDNAHAVQRAAEAWWDAEGAFPIHVYQLLDLLPDGRLLTNPFTYAATEPVDGSSSGSGQVGYMAIYVDGAPRGYTIDAYGEVPTDAPLLQLSEVR